MNKKIKYKIGLEIHVQLNTDEKLFTRSLNCTDSPNTNVTYYDIGVPGTYPHINKQAIEKALILAKIFNCSVSKIVTFDRKHYYYSDLPLGYQVTQQENPIGVNGYYQISNDKYININNIHIEADAGKLKEYGKKILIDYGRCGCPLVEVVTEPDFSTDNFGDDLLEHINTFLLLLINDVKKNNVSNAKLEHSNFRVDVNISCSIEGEYQSPRIEIKNLNSLSSIRDSIIYAQKMLKDKLVHKSTTMSYDDSTKTLKGMRTKVSSDMYMYMYEATLPPFVINDEINNIDYQIYSTLKELNNLKIKLPEIKEKYILKIVCNEYLYSLVEEVIINFNKEQYFIVVAFIFEIKDFIYELGVENNKIIDLCKLLVEKKATKVNLTRQIRDLYTRVIDMVNIKDKSLEVSNFDPLQDLKQKKLIIENNEITVQEIIDIINSVNESDLIPRIKSGEKKAINYTIGLILKYKRNASPSMIKLALEKFANI